MSEVILQPGAVTPSPPSSFGVIPATIVGTQPVWSDGSDSTYVEFTNYISGGYVASLAIATLPPAIVSDSAIVTVRIRGRGLVPVDSSVGVTVGQGSPDVSQWGFQFTDLNPPGLGVASPSSIYNTTAWFTAPLTTPNFNMPLSAATRALFAAGAEFEVFWESATPPSFPVVTTSARAYELEFVVTDSGKFPLRRYPPVNNGGFGPTRHWPRAVNRRAGGTY